MISPCPHLISLGISAKAQHHFVEDYLEHINLSQGRLNPGMGRCGLGKAYVRPGVNSRDAAAIAALEATYRTEAIVSKEGESDFQP